MFTWSLLYSGEIGVWSVITIVCAINWNKIVITIKLVRTHKFPKYPFSAVCNHNLQCTDTSVSMLEWILPKFVTSYLNHVKDTNLTIYHFEFESSSAVWISKLLWFSTQKNVWCVRASNTVGIYLWNHMLYIAAFWNKSLHSWIIHKPKSMQHITLGELSGNNFIDGQLQNVDLSTTPFCVSHV